VSCRRISIDVAASGVKNRYLASDAMLPDGWAKDVLIEVDAAGMISAVKGGATTAERAGAIAIENPVIPGMPNVHSHAFQRAMAGTTERAGPAGDNFWSWREQMYRFLDVLTPEDVETIATYLYVEMLEAGYTSVAEFHYLHHAPDGQRYADPAEMARRIVSAAEAAGIGLTLLPVLYQHSGFDRNGPVRGQRRFVHRIDDYAALIASCRKDLPEGMRLGIAPHSLRAVGPAEFADLLAIARTLPDDAPWHVHAAEQEQEVADCVAATGERPVQWLLNHANLNRHWCVVHATHMTSLESAGLAASGAVAGLCPSTEADLGDGLFDAEGFLKHDGFIGLGGDSHVAVDPFFELRLFEYGQRLTKLRRNLSEVKTGASVGDELYRRALVGGARAVAQPTGGLTAGARADWLVLDRDDPSLCGRPVDTLLDAAIFAPRSRPIKDVMAAGRLLVCDGVHHAREAAESRYRVVIQRLLGSR
jgi:formimidoylglutamate deiminase